MFWARTRNKVFSSDGGCGREVGNSGNLTLDEKSGVVGGKMEVEDLEEDQNVKPKP